MIWDQLLSSWDCDVNSGADSIHNHCVGHGLLPTHPSIWRWLPRFCVLCQWLLATWLLSTWLGDWLASQSPNPSWQHIVSLKHLQNTLILCHFVSLLGMLCHMGGWDMVADTWSASHRNCSKLTKHMALLTIMVLGLLDRQVLRILILQTKIYLRGVATYWVVSVNLIFGRIDKEKAWEIWTIKLLN